ncbi:hypothetical protein LCGC14_0094580 [marine sediment metagenome]|uniref:Radical SAM core domain-containing protein n=1 Tax=marine sediment metagenome TaxID=412755 RepID=A0A0F9VUB9_9ZZZZ|nr:radical SAM protein [Phycisphaerae bacterium]HDZ42583.1 radical SAM protein [Phycisphaerae bacterium]
MAQRPEQLNITGDHRRQWRDCVYVYPVISRRAGGLSVGVNLNLDKSCTFSCVYCQIDRGLDRQGAATGQPHRQAIDLDVLAEELTLALTAGVDGDLWAEERFAETPLELRRINDIAFSGDGEPTCLPRFDEAVAVAARVKADLALADVKIIVITNATQLHRPPFQRAIPILEGANGEVWAKLDAGMEEMFQQINRPHGPVTLDEICEHITALGRRMPVVIQTLFARLHDQDPSPQEIDAYIARLRRMLADGATVKQVQLHTIARSPAEPYVHWLTDAQLDTMASTVRRALPELDITVTYGADMPPQSR